MNPTTETLNQWGGWLLNFAWPMLWQSSLLILVLFAIDVLIRRRIRASIRYALWLVVLVKLCLPPTLALPTSPAWWWHKTPTIATAQPHYTVTYGTGLLPEISRNIALVYTTPKPTMTIAAWLLVASAGVSVLLFAWLLVRWWQVARRARRATHSERLTRLLNETGPLAHVKSIVPVKLTENTMSPAVCGLFHPVILIPTSLVERFSDDQLRVVLLHELIHLRRRDVWVNFLQSLLQIVYWWHPLLWLANARIRRVREEAVDDAVMLALRDNATSYAPTLLEVAKLALNRPLASLGLVGILESRSALRQRIERLVNFHAPRKAGLTLVSLLGIVAFTAVAVPMGGAPQTSPKLAEDASQVLDTRAPFIRIKARFLEVPKGDLDGFGKMIRSTNQADQFVGILTRENAKTALGALLTRGGVEELDAPDVTTTSGRQTSMRSTVIISVITNFVFRETATNTAITPQTSTVETGPILDSIAAVLPDGYTIDLKTTASVTEFLGYDQPTSTVVKYTATGKKITLPTVLPSLSERKTSTHVKLWDGQTVVLGGLKPRFYEGGKEVATEPDFFRKTKAARGQSEEQDKELLVFITVTLVDPTGKRVHSEDEMSFAKNAFPPQVSVPPQEGP